MGPSPEEHPHPWSHHTTPGHPKTATALPQEATEAPPCSDTHFPQLPRAGPVPADPRASQTAVLRDRGSPPLPPPGTALFTESQSSGKAPSQSDETSLSTCPPGQTQSCLRWTSGRPKDAHLSRPRDLWAHKPGAVSSAQGPGWTRKSCRSLPFLLLPQEGAFQSGKGRSLCVPDVDRQTGGQGLASTPEQEGSSQPQV